MMHYFSYLFLIAVPLLLSCEKESDAPIIKGTVKGHIQITDSYGYDLEDLSGVEINISSGNFSADTLTDYDGNFSFENVPFGKYQLMCTKENYVQQTGHSAFGHTGGEVATTVTERLLGIPDFGYLVDSVKLNGCSLNAYVVMNEASKSLAADYYSVVIFFSPTQNVDNVNYEDFIIDYGYHPSGKEWNMSFWCCRAYEEVFSEFESDSVYCRVYPIVYYYNYGIEELLSQPLGKPSNVFGFENPINSGD